MRIFVTGSTGVIGKRVIPRLLAQGHAVSAMVHSAHKRGELEQAGAAAVEADLFDPSSLCTAIEGHDVVVNLATHMPASSLRMFAPFAWHENDRIRRDGAANVARAATICGVERLIQESFAPVYPDRGEEWIDESVAIEPAHYNRSVADAEAAAEGFTASGGTGVVLRFAAFYGPDARHVADLMRFVQRGFAPLFGASTSFISSIAHDDAAAAVVAALEVPAGVYNVCDDEPVRHREYVDALADAMDAPHPRLPPVWASVFGGSLGRTVARSLRISNQKLRTVSRWSPRFPSVREGWYATIAAIREQAGAARAA